MASLALCALLCGAAGSMAPPSDLPKTVLVPTPTEALGIHQLYAVRDGKLWTRRGSGGWELYDGHGVVPGSKSPIVGVFADEVDHFAVVTSDGRLHHHENGTWDSLWGLPSLAPFRAPLSLSVPMDALRAGRVAYSMRRDHVVFYEDKHGRQFNWGSVGTTTLLVLSPDGSRILLGDPWIPPDFSREVCGPRGGTVRMASIATAASSVLAMAVDGALFTSFEDYDANGGTPFYFYSYAGTHAGEPAPLPGSDPASELQTRALPIRGFVAQPAIPLVGRARLSRHIAIVQTGAGNTARELRVVGDDAEGDRGVYRKLLDETTWQFQVADVAVEDDAWIDPHADATLSPPHLAMKGALVGERGLGNVSASTDDFWFHCSPFHLTLTLDGEDVPVTVHTVDSWTVFATENPADSEAYKPMKATVVLDDDVRRALSVRARARLQQLFGDDLGAPFAFAVAANRHELVLAPVGYPWNLERSRYQLVLRTDPRRRARTLAPIHPASRLAGARLTAAGFELDAARSRARCASDGALRHAAAQTLLAVRDARAGLERRVALTAALETALPGALLPADLLTVLTTTRWTLPLTTWLFGFELHAPAVLAAQQLAWARTLQMARADHDDVEGALAACAAAR